jgi:hypothetical protein
MSRHLSRGRLQQDELPLDGDEAPAIGDAGDGSVRREDRPLLRPGPELGAHEFRERFERHHGNAPELAHRNGVDLALGGNGHLRWSLRRRPGGDRREPEGESPGPRWSALRRHES